MINNVIVQLLEFFGIAEVPTAFPDFMFWLCSLLAGVYFVRFTIGTTLNVFYRMNEVSK